MLMKDQTNSAFIRKNSFKINIKLNKSCYTVVTFRNSTAENDELKVQRNHRDCTSIADGR